MRPVGLRPARSNRIGADENSVLNMPRCKAYNAANVTGHGPGAGPMAMSAVEYDTDGMAVFGTGAAGAGLKIQTTGVYACEGGVWYSTGFPNQTYIQRTGPSGTKWSSEDCSVGSPTFWTALPYTGGYSDYGGGYMPGQYMMDALGFVHMRGLFKKTGAPFVNHGPEAFAVLPSPYRPGAHEIFHEMGSSTTDFHFRTDIQSDGQCIWREMSGGAWDGSYMSCSGITFHSVSGNPALRQTARWIVPCVSGDLLQLYAVTGSATNLNGGNDNIYLSACMISTNP